MAVLTSEVVLDKVAQAIIEHSSYDVTPQLLEDTQKFVRNGSIKIGGGGRDCGIQLDAATNFTAFRTDAANRLYVNAGGDSIRFSIGGSSSEKLRITSAGKVGIGTDNPSEVLHVLQSGTTAAEFRLENNEGYLLLRADSNVATYDAQQHIFRSRDGSSEYARITSGGQTLLTRGSQGGRDSTGNASNWMKIGTWYGIDQTSRLKITIFGTLTYDSNADFIEPFFSMKFLTNFGCGCESQEYAPKTS